MDRRLVSLILFILVAVSMAVYGVRPLLLPSPEQVVATVTDDNAREMKSEREAPVDGRPQSLDAQRTQLAESRAHTQRAQQGRLPRTPELSASDLKGRLEKPQGRQSEQGDEALTHAEEEVGIDGLQQRAAELRKEAAAHFKQAVEPSKKGHQRESMEHEISGLELELKANDFISKAEILIQKDRAREMGSMGVLENHDGQEPGMRAVETPPMVEPLRQEAQMLLEQARACTASAMQSRETGHEREAMEYEQMALELESAAMDSLQRAEQTLHDSRFEELRKHETEDKDQPS